MIDKKKLIEKFLSEGWSGRVVQIVENFAEESEIDFDRLRNKFEEEKCNEADCHLSMCNKIACYTNFLKSKHLSAPKQKQVPVKKVWTLKKEYADFIFACGIPNVTIKYCCSEPEHKEFYNITETPDYSQVKVGDVVEVYHSLSKSPNYGIVQKNSNNVLSIICNINSIDAFCINYSQIKSLTILKAAE